MCRRRYDDGDISDDEIEGKRTFNLEARLNSDAYSATYIRWMKGDGEMERGINSRGTSQSWSAAMNTFSLVYNLFTI